MIVGGDKRKANGKCHRYVSSALWVDYTRIASLCTTGGRKRGGREA